MKKFALLLLASTLLATAPLAAIAQPAPGANPPQVCKIGPNLSALAKGTRDRLVRSPGDIGALVQQASVANPQDQCQIELGIELALQYLKTADPSGYQAVISYLTDPANSANPVVAAINSAVQAEASATPGGAGPGAGGGAGAGGGGGGFASGGGASVSPI